MYEEYWGLNRKPFENAFDEQFYYPSIEHERGRKRLKHAATGQRPGALLTGDPGCGKTMLARMHKNRIAKEGTIVSLIDNPQISSDELAQEILKDIRNQDPDTARSSDNLENTLNKCREKGKSVTLIVDEAQSIKSKDVFDLMCDLLGHRDESKSFLSIILVGQTELREQVAALSCLERQFSVTHHLYTLDLSETAGYILHRLTVAGASKPLFTQEAVDMIYAESNGAPRKVNNLCDKCLLEGSLRHARIINSQFFESVLETA